MMMKRMKMHSACARFLSGNEEFWMKDDDPRRKAFIQSWESKCSRGRRDDPCQQVARDDEPSSKCNRTPKLSANLVPSGVGVPEARVDIDSGTRADTRVVSKLSVCASSSRESKGDINCLSNFSLNNISDGKQDDLDDKIENLKILTDQIKISLMKAQYENKSKDGWTKVSLIVDSGVCDIVVDPRALPGYPFNETAVSRAGDAFLIAAGDPIPQLGEKEVPICIESGDFRSIRAQCSTVANPLLFVKRMAEACKCIGFCKDGFFVLDPSADKVFFSKEKTGFY